MTRRRARPRSEDGVTLAEVLVAVSIMGVSIVAIVGAMATSIVGSDVASKQARASAALRSYAEALKDEATTPYAECAGGYPDAAALGVDAPGFTGTVTAVEYWAGDGEPATFRSTCGGGEPDEGVQRLTLTVESTDGRAGEELRILKRGPGS